MKYKIKRVSVSDKKKDGSPLLTKNGNPFLKVGIQVAEHGENWINGLYFASTCPWQEGSEVELIIKDEEFNGVTRKVFEIPKKEDIYTQRIETIENALVKIKLLLKKHEDKLFPPEKDKVPGTDIDYPEPEGVAEDPNDVEF